MQFRPCIDIHNGFVKQIVGSSLNDNGTAKENFVSNKDSAYYAALYRENNLTGGHVILLNKAGTEEYAATKEAAILALKEFPGGLQVGGGITADNALEFISAGASHVIVTSYVFKDGNIDYDNLAKLVKTVGKNRIVLDLSCEKTKDGYVIVTDRWQKVSNIVITKSLLEELAQYCDEYLIHAVDVEGKAQGIEEELVKELASWDTLPITYAGGVHSYKDIEILKTIGRDKLNVTIGSALDLFGGPLSMSKIIELV